MNKIRGRSVDARFPAFVDRSNEDVGKQIEYFQELPLFKQAFDATGSMVLLLNKCTQVIFANQFFLDKIYVKTEQPSLGETLGQVLRCVHSHETSTGCGEVAACNYCGFYKLILKSIKTKGTYSGEFSSVNHIKNSKVHFNMEIHIAPIEVRDETFYIVTFTDIGDSLKVKMFEQIFFHDIINTTGALTGIIGLLKEDVPEEVKPEFEFVENTFKYLVEEIRSQKAILEAENGELVLEINKVDSIEVLTSAIKLYEGHELSSNKTILLDDKSSRIVFQIDYKLLRRILGNMIKNALEATNESGLITIGCNIDRDRNDQIVLWVHNDHYIEKELQRVIFHESFSTKGRGRGLGTYSMKLIGEKYLKGTVGFDTNQIEGTTFYIKLPLNED